MCDSGVRMSGDDDVHQAGWQLACHLKDLARVAARRQVARIVEAVTPATGVGRHDDDRRAGRPQGAGLRRDGGHERRNVQPHGIRRDGGRQGARGHHTDDTDLDACGLDQHGGPHVPPRDGPSRRLIDQVGRQVREPRFSRPLLQRPAWVIGRPARRRGRTDGPEIELMIADGGRGVAEGVVRRHDIRAFGQVRLEGALEGVARVDQQHRATIPGARSTQVVHVPAEGHQSTAAIAGHHATVDVIGADDRQRDGTLSPRRGRCGDGPRSWQRARPGRAARYEQARGQHKAREERKQAAVHGGIFAYHRGAVAITSHISHHHITTSPHHPIPDRYDACLPTSGSA